jgi:hypothetical protein
VLRENTLRQAEVIGELHPHFTVAWDNLLPELYPDTGTPKAYSPEHAARVPEGAGGGNIRIYFCTPDGQIVHQVIGYWKPESLLEEIRFARRLLDQPEQRLALHAERRQRLTEQWRQAEAAVPAQPGKNDPAARRAAQFHIRLRAAQDAAANMLGDIGQALERRRAEVYTKGAVGCDS